MIAEREQPKAPPLDISQLLHDSRSVFLREMPRISGTMVSAGCSGTWYFEWIDRAYGTVERHIGLEFYVEKPSDLPDKIEWIANTVSDMSDVADASCDLVFSGQNLEHLWPEEVAGFFTEAARVIKPGGYLVVDSPNRALTTPFNWSHPEHTVELTIEEARSLFELAGFEVTSVKGIWLCRDLRTERLLPFDPNTAEADWTVTERLIAARNNPEKSFIWWMEGRRGERKADNVRLSATMQAIFDAAWPERSRRSLMAAGSMEKRADENWVIARAQDGGALIYGPFMPLRMGSYEATFSVDVPAGTLEPPGYCEVITGSSATVASIEISPSLAGRGPIEIVVPFELSRLEFGMQFRCVSHARSGFAVRRSVDVAQAGPK